MEIPQRQRLEPTVESCITDIGPQLCTHPRPLFGQRSVGLPPLLSHLAKHSIKIKFILQYAAPPGNPHASQPLDGGTCPIVGAAPYLFGQHTMSSAKRLKDTPLSTPTAQENPEEHSAHDPKRKHLRGKNPNRDITNSPNSSRIIVSRITLLYLIFAEHYFSVQKISREDWVLLNCPNLSKFSLVMDVEFADRVFCIIISRS